MRIASLSLSIRLALLPLALLAGCATQDFVRESVAPVQAQVGELQQRTARNEGDLQAFDARLKGGEERIKALQQEALARAKEANKLSEGGRFLMSMLLQDDRIKFASGRAQLSPEGAAELEQLLAKLKSEDRPVFLEIQGHTDSSGSPALNQQLGQQRAEAVRLHLARAGMPLQRMATISYGESAPLADNASREGRSLNRRVHLVLLR
jgi:outer membrane protein OmpA-like peptidoglycan-associated protein